MEENKQNQSQPEINSGTDSKTETKLRSKIKNSKINWGVLLLLAGCIWAIVEIIRSVLYFFN